jgi:hypothetical protein
MVGRQTRRRVDVEAIAVGCWRDKRILCLECFKYVCPGGEACVLMH